MPKGNEFGVAEKGKYVDTKSGADSMKYGGMTYPKGQSGTVTGMTEIKTSHNRGKKSMMKKGSHY